MEEFQITPGGHSGFFHGSLFDNAMVRFGIGHVDGLIEQRFIRNDACHLDTARGRYDYPGLGIINAHRQFFGGKPAEDH